MHYTLHMLVIVIQITYYYTPDASSSGFLNGHDTFLIVCSLWLPATEPPFYLGQKAGHRRKAEKGRPSNGSSRSITSPSAEAATAWQQRLQPSHAVGSKQSSACQTFSGHYAKGMCVNVSLLTSLTAPLWAKASAFCLTKQTG